MGCVGGGGVGGAAWCVGGGVCVFTYIRMCMCVCVPVGAEAK